jgi:hypothetical protein
MWKWCRGADPSWWRWLIGHSVDVVHRDIGAEDISSLGVQNGSNIICMCNYSERGRLFWESVTSCLEGDIINEVHHEANYLAHVSAGE